MFNIKTFKLFYLAKNNSLDFERSIGSSLYIESDVPSKCRLGPRCIFVGQICRLIDCWFHCKLVKCMQLSYIKDKPKCTIAYLSSSNGNNADIKSGLSYGLLLKESSAYMLSMDSFFLNDILTLFPY